MSQRIRAHLHTPTKVDLASPLITGIGTAYNASKKIDIQSEEYAANGVSPVFNGELKALLFALHNIDPTTTHVTCRLTVDSGGDYAVVGDVEVPIDKGISDSTKGTCQLLIGIPFKDKLLNSDSVYFFPKVNAGSADLVAIQLGWSE